MQTTQHCYLQHQQASKKLIKPVKEHSDEKGLFLNIKKTITKIMDIDKCKKEARIAIDGEEIELAILST